MPSLYRKTAILILLRFISQSTDYRGVIRSLRNETQREFILGSSMFGRAGPLEGSVLCLKEASERNQTQ